MKSKTILFFLVSFSLSSCHVGRFFKWNFADSNDQYKFQTAKVEKGKEAFQFIQPEQDTSKLIFPRTLKINGKKWDFEELLEADKTVAFLIIHKDTLVYEHYFHKYEESTPHTSFSVAKSFVSALMGIAISEGFIKNTDEPITNYLEFENEGFDKITIQHLLDMRSGIAYNESYTNPFSDVAKHYYGLNLNKYLSELKVEKAPDQSFRYISVNTQLLAAIIEKATKKPIYDYLEEKIWKPLGMEYSATWNVDSKKNMTAKAFCCINAVAKDFAKFGRLYLKEGNWDGKQIVPKEWVKATSTFSEAKNGFGYQNQFWHSYFYATLTDSTDLTTPYLEVERKNKKGKEVKMVKKPDEGYWAEGILGQYIYIYPKNDIVIVRLGKKYGKNVGSGWNSVARAIAKMYDEK